MPLVGLYRPGATWNHGKPLGEQAAIDDHMRYLGELQARGVVERAGPLHARSALVEHGAVGLVVFQIEDRDEAERLIEADPAVQRHVMHCDVRPWFV